jgi:hypothetical protein
MLMFDRKIQKNCSFVRVTTSEFVPAQRKFKVVPEGGYKTERKAAREYGQ